MLFYLPARTISEVSHQLCSDCITEELRALHQNERPRAKKNSALRLQLTCNAVQQKHRKYNYK